MNRSVQLHREDDLARQNLMLAGGGGAPGGDRLDLNGLFGTLRRRATLFLSLAIGIFLVGLVLTLRQEPVYTASTTVVIETAREQLTPVGEAVLQDPAAATSPVVDTEVQVLLSSELANKVADALKLDALPRYDAQVQRPGLRQRLRAAITGGTPAVPERAYDAQAQREYVINALRRGLKVTREGLTYALGISFSSPDPVFAAAVANEYGRQYTRQSLLRQRAANANATVFLTRRIAELRAQAQKDTLAVQQYRIANNLLSTNASQLTEQEVSTYNQEVAAARAAAAEDRARLATARRQLSTGSKGDDVGEALSSGVVSSLRTERAGLAAQLAELNARYGPRHPDVLKATERLADLDASIQKEIDRVISNLQAKTSVSGQRLGSIQGSLAGARGTLASSNRALVGFDDLTRRAEASQGLYETYLARLKQALAQEGTEQADARTITWAQVPTAPSSPNIALNMFLAAVLGIGAGLAAAFITELAFRGLTTGEDVESRLGLPYLGGVPLVRSVMKWKGAEADAPVAHPHSAFAEAFRSLHASIGHAIDAVPQVIAVTSALPQEGKSTIAAGLARVIALDGGDVVLVDCDLRRRSVNRLIAEERPAGLIEVLRGTATLDDALVRDGPSGAWLLPIGARRIEPGDHFGGAAMRALLAELRGRFATVILDTAPVLPIADTRTLSTLADAVLFVVRWRKTADHAVASALRLLPGGRARVAGVVLSQLDARRQARFGYGDPNFYYNQYKDYFA